MNIVEEALDFAAANHKSMVRKGTRIPYLHHLLGVCKLLAERDGSEELMAAALLHDVVEDTAVTIQQVEDRFGAGVAFLVRGATEPLKLQTPYNKEGEKESWHERKKHTINFVQREATPEQRLLILADKLDNIQSIAADVARLGPVVWTRFNAGQECQQWYYCSLLWAFEQTAPGTSEAYMELLEAYRAAVQAAFALPLNEIRQGNGHQTHTSENLLLCVQPK